MAAGGGVAFFLGEQTRSEFVNDELYRDGKGLFPLPLGGPADLLVDRLEKTPDLQASEHFHLPLSRQAPQRAPRRGDRCSATSPWPKDWKPRPRLRSQVIARLRNGAPLVVERSFGKGRVVAFLTTAAPGVEQLGRQQRDRLVPAGGPRAAGLPVAAAGGRRRRTWSASRWW